MGWIREHMEELTPPVNSFSGLARKVRSARSWPPEEKLKPTSLATYLGRLDEGEVLEQFEQRRGVFQALAEVLGMTMEDMEEQLGRLWASKAEQNTQLKLHDMPVRTIDLQRDPPPPGLPGEVLAPEHWPLWWHAPSGSGRTWAGRWLAARRLAVFIQAPTWADAERQLPAQGSVFIELGSAEGAPLHDRWAPTLRICVATEAYSPQPPAPQVTSGEENQPTAPLASWELVESPPVRSWLQPLMEWLKERTSGEQLDTEACLKWLEETGVLSRGDSLGTVLGLIGLFTTYVRKPGSPSPLDKAQSLADMARLFLRMRGQQEEEAVLPVKVLWERLRIMGRRLVLEHEGSWFEARPLEDWHSLAHARPDGSDLEWLHELGAHGLTIDQATLDKARSELPPDAFRTVRALRELGLLREREPRLFAFRPPWVLEGIIQQVVRDTISQEAPGIWGTLLLRQEQAGLVMQHLLDCCRSGNLGVIEKVVAAPETSSPAWVAAFEACFRILGLVVLEGLRVPELLIRVMLRLQRRLLVPSSDGAPQPRLAYSHQLAREHPLLDESVWYSALLVMAESLPPGDELSLESWCKGLPADAARWMIDMVGRSGKADEVFVEPWKMPLFLLGGRLIDRLIIQTEPSLVPLVARPEKLLRALQQESPSLSEVEQLLPWGDLAKNIPEYARRRGVDWKPLARKLWTIWLATESKLIPNFLDPRQDHAVIFWSELPPEAVGLFVERRDLRWVLDLEETCTLFQREHWDAFVEAWAALKVPRWVGRPPRVAWRSIPSEHVRRALRVGLPDAWDHETRRELWQRMPEVFCEEIDTLFKQGQWDHALIQAWEVPPAFFRRVLASAETALEREGASVPPVFPRWLRDAIRSRVPGWERAWTLLERLAPTEGQVVSPPSRG